LFIRNWHGGMGWIGTVCLRWLCIPRLGLSVVRFFFWRTRYCTTVTALSLVQSSSQNRSSCLLFIHLRLHAALTLLFVARVLPFCDFVSPIGWATTQNAGMAHHVSDIPDFETTTISLVRGFWLLGPLRWLHGLEFKLKSLRSDEWLDFE
jgi:hypothetical protein